MLIMRVYFEKPRTTVGWKGECKSVPECCQVRCILPRVHQMRGKTDACCLGVHV